MSVTSLLNLVTRSAEREVRLIQLSKLESLQGKQTFNRKEAINWFHQVFRHCPLPTWIKDEKHISLAVNPAYSELYEVAGTQGLSFIGKDDTVWPEAVAEDFHKHDKRALVDGYVITHEHIRNPITNIQESIIGAKWILILEDGEQLLIGIASGNIPKPIAALRDGR